MPIAVSITCFNLCQSPSDLNASQPYDIETLMALQSLEWRARVLVDGIWSGQHRSLQHGHSQQFKEYRAYSPGDDLRYFDWKRYAKSGREVVKVFEDESQMNVLLIQDISASMLEHYSTSFSKLDYSSTLLATLSLYCEEKGDRYGLFRFSDELEGILPSKCGPSHLSQCFAQLDQSPHRKGSDLGKVFDLILQMQLKPSLIVLASDLLFDFEPLLEPLQQVLAVGHEIMLLQILDRRETDFGFEKTALFEDVESGQVFQIDPEISRESYLQAMRGHREKWMQLSERYGLSLETFLSDELMDSKLRSCFEHRHRLGQLHRRRF